MSRLPSELIELILDQLALKPRDDHIQELLSCSLANRTLAAFCQKRIFSTVKLWIHVPTQDRPPSAETLELHRRASLFIRAVTQNPLLGLHVQCLSHFTTCTPTDSYDPLGDILAAFYAMPNIVDLELGHRLSGPLPASGRGTGLGFDPGTRRPTGLKSVWRDAIFEIVKRPSLGVLRLVNIERFPIGVLSAGIRELHLSRSWFGFRNGDWEVITAFPQRRISSLTCDSGSLLRFVNVYLSALKEPDSSPQDACVDLSRLESLCMTLQMSPKEEYLPILKQVICLKEAEFTVRQELTSYPRQVAFTSSPLHHIHPASRGTLTHLRLRHFIYFEASNIHLSSPYTNVLGDALIRLPVLETLRVDIFLHHFLDLHLWTFTRGGWKHLPDSITQPGACPRLRELSIRIHIRASDTTLRGAYHEGVAIEKTTQECKEDADRLAQKFDNVYPAVFLGMMEQRPEVELSFVVEVSVGHDLR